jgi:hypothetical protein
MRSSITKSLVVALSLTAAVTFAAPAHAAARKTPVNQGRFEERFRDQDPVFRDAPVQRFIRLVRKVVIVVQEFPSVPLP